MTRDALEVVDGLKIGQYVARTSLPSIVSAPSPWVNSLDLTFTEQAHPWHRRVVEADFRKTHEEQISQMAGGHVVLDLIEERVELVETEPGEYVTRSQILAAMSDFDQFATERVRVFSERGFEVWTAAVPRFAAMLERHVPPERTLIHRALYASEEEEADKRANHYLRLMYDVLAEAIPGARVITPSEAVLAAEPDHKWGRAPFHYRDAYYFEIAAKILAACGLDLPFKVGFTFRKASPAH